MSRLDGGHMKPPTKVRYWHSVDMRCRVVHESIEILTDEGHSYNPERFLCRSERQPTQPIDGMRLVSYMDRSPMTEMPLYRTLELGQAQQLRDSLTEALR